MTIQKISRATGFCNNGQHENTSILSERGSLLKPCQGEFNIQGVTYLCMCTCHEVSRQLFELTGVRMQPAAAPAQTVLPGLIGNDLIGTLYGPPSVQETAEPTDTRATGERPAAATTTGAAGIYGDAPRPVMPIRSVKSATEFKPTASGMRARGQLEAECATLMLKWFRLQPEENGFMLSPELVRAGIKSEPQPSNGAIYAVFQRWARQGFVVLNKKPFGIVKPTPQGITSLRRWA